MKKAIESFIPDNRNFNRGTEYGSRLLEKSLSQLGAGRSILVDKNNRIIAGNKTHQAAIDIGLTDAVVVETTGNELVVVKRTDVDIDSKEGRELALADNKTADANLDWDMEELQRAVDDFDIDLSEWGMENQDTELDFDADEDEEESDGGSDDTVNQRMSRFIDYACQWLRDNTRLSLEPQTIDKFREAMEDIA